MSRVEQALRRAASAPSLAPADDRPVASGEVWTDQPLDLYPVEKQAVTAVAAPSSNRIEMRPRPAVQARESADAPVDVRIGKAYRGKVWTGENLSPVSIEQYRRLAATLHHVQSEQGLRTLMVTSAVPQEGKTLTVANLGMTLSESYNRRVLLIDADLRRPSLHEVFGLSQMPGLSDALRSESGALKCPRVSSRLWVLPAGSSQGDPMGALASERLPGLLEEVGSSFDWVLIDAPPVGLMADAGLLVKLTRAVILVIGANSTPYKVVEKVVTEIGRENIVGTVLNRIDDAAVEWSGYYADAIPRSSVLGTRSAKS